MTDRMNNSNNWHQNVNISQNILNDIINYSNYSQTNLKSLKSKTVAVYDRHEDVLNQLSKINKKSSLADLGKK